MLFADDFWRLHIQDLPLALQDRVQAQKLFPEKLIELIRRSARTRTCPGDPAAGSCWCFGGRIGDLCAGQTVLGLASRAAGPAGCPAARQQVAPGQASYLLREMDAYLCQDQCFPIPGACLRLRRGRLETAFTSRATARPGASFFDACEELGRCHDALADYLTWLKSEFVACLRRNSRVSRSARAHAFRRSAPEAAPALVNPGADQLVQAMRARFRAA